MLWFGRVSNGLKPLKITTTLKKQENSLLVIKKTTTFASRLEKRSDKIAVRPAILEIEIVKLLRKVG